MANSRPRNDNGTMIGHRIGGFLNNDDLLALLAAATDNNDDESLGETLVNDTTKTIIETKIGEFTLRELASTFLKRNESTKLFTIVDENDDDEDEDDPLMKYTVRELTLHEFVNLQAMQYSFPARSCRANFNLGTGIYDPNTYELIEDSYRQTLHQPGGQGTTEHPDIARINSGAFFRFYGMTASELTELVRIVHSLRRQQRTHPISVRYGIVAAYRPSRERFIIAGDGRSVYENVTDIQYKRNDEVEFVIVENLSPSVVIGSIYVEWTENVNNSFYAYPARTLMMRNDMRHRYADRENDLFAFTETAGGPIHRYEPVEMWEAFFEFVLRYVADFGGLRGIISVAEELERRETRRIREALRR